MLVFCSYNSTPFRIILQGGSTYYIKIRNYFFMKNFIIYSVTRPKPQRTLQAYWKKDLLAKYEVVII